MKQNSVRFLVFAGSTRKDSYNRRVAQKVTAIAESLGMDVTHLELKDYPLPMFDEDIESDAFPENAKKLRALFAQHDGFIIVTPEYNSGIPAVLKNTLDWVSRPFEEVKSLALFHNKTAFVVSASPSPLGGLRAQFALRYVLQNIGVLSMPETITVPKIHELLAHSDTFEFDQYTKEKLDAGLKKLLAVTTALDTL